MINGTQPVMAHLTRIPQLMGTKYGANLHV